jgi:AbrB family looped-hinge helix DNA binding protein
MRGMAVEQQIIRVRDKGQITLSQSVRERLQIEENDYMVAEIVDEKVVLYKLSKYRKASMNDGICKMIGSAEDKEGKTDVSTHKHKYLGEKQ